MDPDDRSPEQILAEWRVAVARVADLDESSAAWHRARLEVQDLSRAYRQALERGDGDGDAEREDAATRPDEG